MYRNLIKRNFGYNFGRAKLNPEKHMYLYNYQNEYESKMFIGRFFLPKNYAEANGGYYKEEVIRQTFNFMKSINDKFNLKYEDYNETYLDSWQLYDVSLDKNKERLMDFLSENIYNNNSNKRYLIEKDERSKFMKEYFKYYNFDKENIQHFIYLYSVILDYKNELDNGERSKEILGKPTSYEQTLYEDKSHNSNLIEEFDNKENHNIINKFMKYLHC